MINEVATNLLKKFGNDCIIKIKNNSVFDVDSGKYIEDFIEFNSKYAYIDINNKKIKESGYTLKNNDATTLINLKGIEDFSISSILKIKGKDYKISHIFKRIELKEEDIAAIVVISK